ncbi:MAG TPA: 50S ribosomal protein L20 [Candidatus Polarisedimenticolia bacterium]|nr:50S ribosomal protein L20 [Candidatus Polarisedimenticolia bacterium]
MPRVKRGTKRKDRRKKILGLASGFYGGKSRMHRIAKQAVEKSLGYAYRDRRARKRDFRKLWIVRINAAARLNGLSYSQLMDGLRKAGIALDRKVLADLAVTDPAGFTEVAVRARGALGRTAPAA